MINKIKNDNLKFFLYKFFIVWNIFVIILLVFINIQIEPKKIFTKSNKNNILFGQLKLKWKSKFSYSTNLTITKQVALIALNDDRLKDVISLNGNNLIGYNGKNGNILFNVLKNSNIKFIKAIKNKYFLVCSKDGNIVLYNNKTKNIWKQNFYTDVIKIFDADLIICLSNQISYLNPESGKIKKIINLDDNIISINNKVDINNDKIKDIIFTSTNYITCIDGKSGKFIWQNRLNSITNQILNVFSYSGNKIYIILKNKNNIIVLNKFGLKVGKLYFSNSIKKVVKATGYKKEYILLLDEKNILYAYNIKKLQKAWEKKILENSVFVKNLDLNYDRNDELIIINSRGNGIVLNAINSKKLDEFNLGNYDSIISSNIIINDIDNDSNYEIIFGDEKGYVYSTKYVVFRKKILNLIIDKILRI